MPLSIMNPNRGTSVSTATLIFSRHRTKMNSFQDFAAILIRLVLFYSGCFLCVFLPLGGSVIVNPPHSLTKLEGDKAYFPCEVKVLPGNVTVVWKRENIPIVQHPWLNTRSIVRKDGTLVINPISAGDGGFFTCEVSNGIGTIQRATTYLNVESVGGGTPKPKRQEKLKREFPSGDEEVTTAPPEPLPEPLALGPKPDPPTDLNVKQVKDGFLITWKAPVDSPVPVQYYDIEYKIDSGWKKLNKENIVGETSFKVKKLMSDTRYAFRVLAKTVTSFDTSGEFIFQNRVIRKEDRAENRAVGIVGGMFFFILAIILSVCM